MSQDVGPHWQRTARSPRPLRPVVATAPRLGLRVAALVVLTALVLLVVFGVGLSY